MIETGRRTALILGATGGGIGWAVTAGLLQRGWKIRALHRNPAAASARGNRDGLSWVAGDAMDATSVVAAAEGVSLIVHAVNPPGYRNWDGLVMPMLDNSILAAETSGARILLPGTVYNYGPEAFPTLAESDRQSSRTGKGAIRVRMEQRLEQAADRGVRSLVVRGPATSSVPKPPATGSRRDWSSRDGRSPRSATRVRPALAINGPISRT